MEQDLSDFICIFNWKKDKILLSYPDELESWEICHIDSNEVIGSHCIIMHTHI